MTSDDDDDRTVFGQRLPQKPAAQPSQKGADPGLGQERTIFGMPIPNSAQQPPPQQPGYQPNPAVERPLNEPQIPEPRQPTPQQITEDTWFGGRTPVQQQRPAAAPPHGVQHNSPRQPAAPRQAAPQSNWGTAPYQQQTAEPGWSAQTNYQDQQFPDAQVQPAAPHVPTQKKIAFADALRGSGLNIGQTSNPILAAATDLLILLGRLRTGIVEMHAVPLRDHVVRAIQEFVQKAQEHGVSSEDIEVARYALAATADDIVQTIPGTDPAYWQQFSMSAELLNDRSTGIGFFQRLEQVMGLAHQRRHVLELMLTCLSLGFEGKFRTEANGAVALTRARNEVYQRYRSVEPPPGQDLSIYWMPVLLGGRRNATKVPIWIFGGVAAGMVVALFATLSGILSSDAQASQNAILALHDPNVEVALETKAGAPERQSLEAPVPAQLDRVRGLLKPEIDEGLVVVDSKGYFIALRVGSQLRFKSGSADLNSNFEQLAQRLGAVFEAEGGGIIVEGHSDNIPLSGRGRYRSNEELSEARAKTVMDIIEGFISDPSRLSAVGVGPNDPLDTANTADARRKNRRVEILLERKG